MVFGPHEVAEISGIEARMVSQWAKPERGIVRPAMRLARGTLFTLKEVAGFRLQWAMRQGGLRYDWADVMDLIERYWHADPWRIVVFDWETHRIIKLSELERADLDYEGEDESELHRTFGVVFQSESDPRRIAPNIQIPLGWIIHDTKERAQKLKEE